MAPRILLDATAVPADRGGLGRYVDGLLEALYAQGADLAVVCQRADEERYAELVPGARVVAGPATLAHRATRLAWEQSGLPHIAARVAADVIHLPTYTMPVSVSLPTVVTLHDVTSFAEPETHDPVRAGYVRSATRTAARRATRLIAPSRATRDELVRVLDADPSHIDVAYHGVDHQVFHRPSEAEIKHVSDRLGLHGHPYVAYLGALEPRKNVPNLIRGWVEACKGRPGAPALVLAGGGGWDDDVDAALSTVPLDLRVVRPGYLLWSALPGFFGGALVVAHPSRGEGFGLPVLEAMSCGAPVLTTRRGPLPEVGGDAVAYTEPDPSDIATALAALIDDPARRADLAEAAHARAQRFSWAESATAHLASYERAVEQYGAR
ncbi:glycosyltransferase involved in cell wall biosynthesis [Actinomadura pelletieri DSM 43383]|uniref:Glycosyltransferase involved in cell wall biosynthesis n=1 Tax=Actinomadura pelletieri DSM 43383 TaxID=1120940 RepID=A0A495QSE4_9ACTN|nr:glycosyltransferase family 1 protein [Actinomadura pelletieri]RKS76367.1 glycosyltransferase involved in cell wall biosynthesis [Actinomadura pelletieri DSM 43383]